mmetsp:Transcript_81645/g.263521  ORF Transcript_81645/g.263521 Transcript_81645/m.263521 type:complete len:205 (-) Transcript_81645:90-704(-)
MLFPRCAVLVLWALPATSRETVAVVAPGNPHQRRLASAEVGEQCDAEPRVARMHAQHALMHGRCEGRRLSPHRRAQACWPRDRHLPLRAAEAALRAAAPVQDLAAVAHRSDRCAGLGGALEDGAGLLVPRLRLVHLGLRALSGAAHRLEVHACVHGCSDPLLRAHRGGRGCGIRGQPVSSCLHDLRACLVSRAASMLSSSHGTP